jgi:predicted TIM-barrel fold metal-dependent hydrolase
MDDDPGLPIKLHPCSNGEYMPAPATDVVREATRRALADSEANARRMGVSRRQFLMSVCGAATGLLALDACSKEAARSAPRSTGAPSSPGGTFSLPSEATLDPGAARTTLAGSEFIMDVQGHLLEYDLNPATRGRTYFGQVFPQADCGEDDPRACFTIDHFMEEIFLKSDTSLVVLSALPIAPEDSPLSIEIMEETRRVATALCRDDRVLLHGQALPNVGPLAANLDGMEALVRAHPIAAWKTYTHFPDDRTAWRLDDGDPGAMPVGRAFVEKAISLGVPTICVHKGFSGGSRFASPADIGPAAKAFPAANFVVYHSGYEAGQPEGPYVEETSDVGVNRLITSLRRAGVGPNQNVYAELGSTWRSVMGSPTEAAHVLGKLLSHVGHDNVVWGTDSIWYGSPQDQIQAFRAFQITTEFQERFGYPSLTKETKAKILGLNSARLYKVKPDAVTCRFSRDDLERIRPLLTSGHRTYGPTTMAGLQRLRAHHQGWP